MIIICNCVCACVCVASGAHGWGNGNLGSKVKYYHGKLSFYAFLYKYSIGGKFDTLFITIFFLLFYDRAKRYIVSAPSLLINAKKTFLIEVQ